MTSGYRALGWASLLAAPETVRHLEGSGSTIAASS
jgi:hypothetical protein